MTVNANPYITTNGLLLALDAANPKSYLGSGIDWYDILGGTTAVLQNGVTYNNSNLGSLVFDGTTQGVDLNKDYFSVINQFSVEVWFNPSGVKTGAQMLVYQGQGDGFGGNNEFHVHYNQGGSVSAWMTGGISITSSNGLVPNNTYGQIIYTVSGLDSTATGSLYYNTSLIGTSTGTINRTGYNTNTLVARPYSLSFPAIPRTFEGKISLVFFYDFVLTTDQISRNFNALRGRYGV